MHHLCMIQFWDENTQNIILVRQLYSQRRIRVNCAVNPISKHCMKGTKQACQVQKQTLEFFEAIIQSLVR